MLELLSRDDLESVSKTMMIDRKYRKNMETLKSKLITDYKTLTKSNFGAMTPADRLKRCVRKTINAKRFLGFTFRLGVVTFATCNFVY